MNEIRHNWTAQEIIDIYNRPLMDLLYEAATVHRQYHDPNTVQVSTLLSVKTGGCSEDCCYCSQSARYHTEVEIEPMMSTSLASQSLWELPCMYGSCLAQCEGWS